MKSALQSRSASPTRAAGIALFEAIALVSSAAVRSSRRTLPRSSDWRSDKQLTITCKVYSSATMRAYSSRWFVSIPASVVLLVTTMVAGAAAGGSLSFAESDLMGERSSRRPLPQHVSEPNTRLALARERAEALEVNRGRNNLPIRVCRTPGNVHTLFVSRRLQAHIAIGGMQIVMRLPRHKRFGPVAGLDVIVHSVTPSGSGRIAEECVEAPLPPSVPSAPRGATLDHQTQRHIEQPWPSAYQAVDEDDRQRSHNGKAEQRDATDLIDLVDGVSNSVSRSHRRALRPSLHRVGVDDSVRGRGRVRAGIAARRHGHLLCVQQDNSTRRRQGHRSGCDSMCPSERQSNRVQSVGALLRDRLDLEPDTHAGRLGVGSTVERGRE